MFPETFHFTQSNLQDYLDCPRRFQLRYVMSQVWPGVEAEPFLEHERYLERGVEFHRLVERHQLGIGADVLEAHIDDPEMRGWWQRYLGFEMVHQLEGQRFPELLVSVELGGGRFLGVFDLLVDVPDGRVVIFDWKTYRKMPSRQWLEARAQTRLYLLLVVLAAERVLGREVLPEEVSMVYWCVSGAVPVVFECFPALFDRDRAVLMDVVDRVSQVVEGVVWSLASDEEHCRFCSFRSLCGRGDRAGEIPGESNMEDNIACWELDFVLGGVDEVGF